MPPLSHPLRFLLVALAGWINQQQSDAIDYLGVTHGRRFRVGTTVVETNVRYPTDSTLLQDGVRVLTRTMQRASTALGDPPVRIRHRLRSVTRTVLTLAYQARSPKTRTALVQSYRTLMATACAVQREATTIVRRLGQRVRTASPTTQRILQRAQDQAYRGDRDRHADDHAAEVRRPIPPAAVTIPLGGSSS